MSTNRVNVFVEFSVKFFNNFLCKVPDGEDIDKIIFTLEFDREILDSRSQYDQFQSLGLGHCNFFDLEIES